MILTRKIAAWTMTATAGLLFLAPSAAHADWNDCPANSFCLWEHPEATGRMVVVGQGSSGIP
ncbi:MAG: peptidase inhibitor family I36 protein, partial [Actinoplanes sp.]